MDKQSPTFKDNGYRVIRCPACHKKLGKKGHGAVFTYLGATKTKYYTCCHCGAHLVVPPPTRATGKDGKPVILWGDKLLNSTVDLTDEGCESTISADTEKD